MKRFEATTTIQATPETIWQILTKAEAYPQWDPNMMKLEGTIALGQRITAYTTLDPGRPFPAKVTVFEPNRQMVWASGLPLGLFKGERTFSLTPNDDGTVTFKCQEEFTGLLMPIFNRAIPDLTKSFRDFVAGLKKEAEGR
ncbi:MAG: SRPBCC domain-containing protein [Ardenticatenaceae bacterium]|nr:SRPBCC domain-containing protein [Ardenticatenaceae bacterium]